MNRRQFLGAAGTAVFPAFLPQAAFGAPPLLEFGELYSGRSVLGLTFSGKLKQLAGRKVRMRGFMAPPLKAEASFFVLTGVPVSLCPFCNSDADWPEDIIMVLLGSGQDFVQNNCLIEVEGVLDIGSQVDELTGFVSLVRLLDARFWKV